MVKAHFHEGVEDSSWKVRQSWIKLAGTQIKDGEETYLIIIRAMTVFGLWRNAIMQTLSRAKSSTVHSRMKLEQTAMGRYTWLKALQKQSRLGVYITVIRL